MLIFKNIVSGNSFIGKERATLINTRQSSLGSG